MTFCSKDSFDILKELRTDSGRILRGFLGDPWEILRRVQRRFGCVLTGVTILEKVWLMVWNTSNPGFGLEEGSDS